MTAPLLVVDGDSFAHRAFHALPRSIRRADGSAGNLLTGLVSMLLRLWEAEQPRAVFVGWDTLFVPTYRHEALAGYQAGREFDPELLEQLDLAPGLLEAAGIVCAKAPGYEADDFLAAAVSSERKRKGRALVATSDRDAFQLVADDVTILQPVRGVSEMARIDPAGVRERSVATRPTRSLAHEASAPRPQRRFSRSTAVSTPFSTTAGSRKRPMRSGCTGASRRSTRAHRYPRFPTGNPTGALVPPPPPRWASAGSRVGWRKPHRADLAPGAHPTPSAGPAPPPRERAAARSPPRSARRRA